MSYRHGIHRSLLRYNKLLVLEKKLRFSKDTKTNVQKLRDKQVIKKKEKIYSFQNVLNRK